MAAKARKVVYFSTQNNEKKSVTTKSTTWGELKAELGVSDDLKVVVKETRVTLENPLAELPKGEFTLFLFPNKVKSGHTYSQIKELRTKFNKFMDEILGEPVKVKTTAATKTAPAKKVATKKSTGLSKEAQDLAKEMGF